MHNLIDAADVQERVADTKSAKIHARRVTLVLARRARLAAEELLVGHLQRQSEISASENAIHAHSVVAFSGKANAALARIVQPGRQDSRDPSQPSSSLVVKRSTHS